jgi:hypothetical protein
MHCMDNYTVITIILPHPSAAVQHAAPHKLHCSKIAEAEAAVSTQAACKR